MIVATTVGIVMVPFFFVMVYKIKEKFKIPELKFPKLLRFKRKKH